MLNSMRRTCAAAVLAIVLAAQAPAMADPPAGAAASLLKEKAPALVAIKFVLKVKFGGQEQERESEITGVMMDPKGLIICSSQQIGGISPAMKRMMNIGDMTATPTDLKVLIGDDTEGVEAKLLSRDSELDLAWIQIKKPGDKKYDYIDFTHAAVPEIDQRLLSIRRMGKHFDRTPVLGEARLGAILTKPRRLFVPTEGLPGSMGTPVFTADGTFVGLTVLQLPEDDEGSGTQRAMQEGASGLILPAAEVLKATKRAMENPEPEPPQKSADKDNSGKKDKDASKSPQPTTRKAAAPAKD